MQAVHEQHELLDEVALHEEENQNTSDKDNNDVHLQEIEPVELGVDMEPVELDEQIEALEEPVIESGYSGRLRGSRAQPGR